MRLPRQASAPVVALMAQNRRGYFCGIRPSPSWRLACSPLYFTDNFLSLRISFCCNRVVSLLRNFLGWLLLLRDICVQNLKGGFLLKNFNLQLLRFRDSGRLILLLVLVIANAAKLFALTRPHDWHVAVRTNLFEHGPALEKKTAHPGGALVHFLLALSRGQYHFLLF